jgi:hypothetical protein
MFTPRFELASYQTRIRKADHTTAIFGKNTENLKLIACSNFEFEDYISFSDHFPP